MGRKIAEFVKKNKIFLIGLILTSSLLWPLFVAPYFFHHDDVQVIRVYQMHKCFEDFQIPCRWVPDLGGLYGYPLFNYYAPLPYYFGEIIYLLTGNLLISAKIMFAFSFLGAYVFMFFLGRRLWGEKGGLLSGVLYSFAPYHALDFYIRGAMGEMWALMFFPAIFWSIIRLSDSTKIIRVLVVGLLLASLVLSHNLSAMIFLPVALILVILIYLHKREFRFLKFFFVSLILGFSLSAFYSLPAVTEKDLVHVETTTFGYFSYTEHFKGVKKLFLERSWEYGSSIREVPGGEKDKLSYQIGLVHLLGWVLSLLAAVFLWKKSKLLSSLIFFSTLVIIASVFMINPRSEFIWKLIEPLKYLQFPWRFLMFVIFFISLIGGSILLIIKREKYKQIALLLGVLLTIFLNFSYFKPEKFIQTNDQMRLSGSEWDKQIKRSIFDYLPKSAKAPPAELADRRYEIMGGESNITNFKEGSDWVTFDINTKTLTTIRLSKYYFPNWIVKVGEKQVEINPRNELGLITFAVDPGVYKVEAKLEDTPIRVIANVITLLGLLVFIFLILTQFPKTRKWLFYYIRGIN